MWCHGRLSGRSSFTEYHRTVGQVGLVVEEKVKRPSKVTSVCNPRNLGIPVYSASAASALTDMFNPTAAAVAVVVQGPGET